VLRAFALLALAACAERAPTDETRSSLRVPLPDGWKATAVAGGLHVGPPGHITLQLESTARPMPTVEAFLAAIDREKVKITSKEVIDGFVGVRYRLADDSEGFLGVRRTGPRTIWCASTKGTTADEVEAAMTVCRSLSWDSGVEKG
jgi:hypothetical protein